MVMIGGEKYACESCVRGHRVSNCKHEDRPLQHINKKGRPISQCQHCRSMRRSKSTHVKCDCGEKTSKCVHLQPTLKGHRDSCCCNHGASCSCSHKKEPLDTVPEFQSDQETNPNPTNPKLPDAARNRRSRASTQNSDGMLMFDEHGHNIPTYKNSEPQQLSTSLYQLSRSYAMQSDSSVASSSMENLVNGSPIKDAENNPQAQDQRLTKSETASPLMTGSSSIPHSSISLPLLDIPPSHNLADMEWNFIMPPNLCKREPENGWQEEVDQPLTSASPSALVDWNQYDLGFGKVTRDCAPSSYGGGPSFCGLDQPSALTSAQASDVGDLGPTAGQEFDLDPLRTFSRTNTSSTGFSFNASQESQQNAIDLGLASLDFEFPKASKDLDETKFFESALHAVDGAMAAATNSQPLSGLVVDDDPFCDNMFADGMNWPMRGPPAF